MIDLHNRVLVLSASQRDSEATCDILLRAKLACVKCKGLVDLEAEVGHGAGVLILAKEVLTTNSVSLLSDILNRQPAWSFLPVILLVSAGDLALANVETLRLLKPILKNTTLLERPVRVGALVSVVQAALADRARQYEVRDLLLALEASKQEALDASATKSVFLANMSHEIRTPLGAILGFSELLMEPAVSEREKSSYMHSIKRNGQLLSALIDDILDLAKVEAGRIDVELLDVSINELVSEVISALEPRASAKGIPLVVKWDSSLSRTVQTDPIRLKQVLINIMGNAIKFTDSGSVTLKVWMTPSVDSKESANLYFEVIDTGLGISSEQAEQLFRAFTQADSSITRKFGGTGLGLVLSRKLTRLLGGDLRLKSSHPGQGSVFEFCIQVGIAAATAKPLRVVGAPVSRAPQSLDDMRILLVDDSKDNQALIGRMLTLSGAKVETASDGVEGVEKALNENFDLVIMDVQMPRLGGREATVQLRKNGYSKPVIALTAHALQEDRLKCFEAGCDAYLTKPVQRLELLQVVAQFGDPARRL